MDRWKSRGGKSQRRERVSRKKIIQEKESEERRCRCAKRYKSREWLCFSNSGGSKSTLAKAAGAEPSRQMGDEKIARHCGAKRVGGEKAKSTSCPEHFWQLRPLW